MVDGVQLTKALENAHLDVVVATSPENVLYLSGLNILTQRLIPERLAFVVWPTGGLPVVIVCIHEEPQARRSRGIQDIRTYFEFAESPLASCAAVITEMGLASARIGLEKRHLTASHVEEWTSLLPAAESIPADDLFSRLRMVKTQSEVAVLEAVAQATDRAVWAAFDYARAGHTERSVANVMRAHLLTQPVDDVHALMLGAGPNASLIHQLPTDYVLTAGDVCRVDVGGVKGGYLSDLARSAVVGAPTPRQHDAYRRLWAVHETVIGSVRAGVAVSKVYAAYERISRGEGIFRKRPHIGHGLGLGMHEDPMITPHGTQVLREGMVLCLEYTCLIDDAVFHIEDTVHVAGRGCRILSRSADWSHLPVIGVS
jgi:Xaa-Pro aminopeptidase